MLYVRLCGFGNVVRAEVAAFQLSVSQSSEVAVCVTVPVICVGSAEPGAFVQLCHTKTTSQLGRMPPRRKLPHAE